MKLSLSNGIFSKYRIDENFAAAKQLGFRDIEFNMKSIKKEHDTDVYREQKALAASGLNCLTLHSAVLHVKDPIEVHQAVYYGKISLECARALHAPLMTVHSNISKKLSRQVREECLKEVFGQIRPFAKQLGVKLSLENLSFNSTGFGKNVEQIDEVLGVIDPKSEMGITFDLCHALETNVVDELLDAYGRRVCNVHMAGKSHQPFMEKKPELTDFLSALHAFGYSGPITLELNNKTSLADISKTKSFFEELLKEY
ncbi:MAG TPA: sugar phosphate isomerase/epimerase family protein [Candidatus Acidoferrales bacterium]|nr:sugar phosphate isomerase/epimerase family protein [Candidatus Acidoferrales bacterium]